VSDASQNDDRLAIEIFRPAAKAAWFRPEIEKLLNDPTTYRRPLAQGQYRYPPLWRLMTQRSHVQILPPLP